MILDSLDFEAIFCAAKNSHYSNIEICFEKKQFSSFKILDKIESNEFYSTQSTLVRLYKDEEQQDFIIHLPDTKKLIALIENRNPFSEQRTPYPYAKVPPPNFLAFKQRTQTFSQMVKNSCLESLGIQKTRFSYLETETYLESFSMKNPELKIFEETSLEWNTTWRYQDKHHSLRFTQNNPKKFFDWIKKENPLKEAVEKSRTHKILWPAPKGEINIFWKAQALAPLYLFFARAFEDDLIKNQRSFLASIETLTLPFDLKDFRENELTLWSNSLKQNTLTIQHSRRTHVFSPETICLKNPKIISHKSSNNILSNLQKGLLVSEIEVLNFNSKTGDIEILLSEMRLIHQGILGEFLEPVTLETNLMTLLKSLCEFEEKSRSIGFNIQKHQQNFIVEVDCSDAISNEVPIAGTVEQSHYW